MKKLLSILLCIMLCFTALTGCIGGQDDDLDASGNKVTDQSKILDISIWNSGYGVKWINAIADQYKKDHPGVAININEKYDQNDYNTTIQSSNTNKTDIYFNYAPNYLHDKEFIEPLDDILATTIEGESKTIGEKIGENALSALSIEENGVTKTYALHYGSGGGGIVYNADKFEEYELSIPKTTDELINLVVEIQELPDGKYSGLSQEALPNAPVCHVPGYSSSLVYTWWAQYSGKEAYDKFFTFEDITFEEGANKTDISHLKDVRMQEGMRIGLQALYDFIAPEGVTYKGSNTQEFSILQSNFIEHEVALMYPCGGWLETELEKADGFNLNTMNKFKVMRTPVISALASKLSIGEEANDQDLRDLIDYVDEYYAEGNTEATAPSWATADDIQLVKTARFVSTGQTASSTVLIPKYSAAKDLAKDFLKYLYSDEGLKLFAETQRNFLSVSFSDESIIESIDKSSWTNFSKSVFDISRVNELIPQNLNHPIWYEVGRREVFTGTTPEVNFTYEKTNQNYMDVDEYINKQWSEFQKEWKASYFKYF